MRRSKPAGWPRYMTAVALADGKVGYYWRPRLADKKAGLKMESEALGPDYATAKARADALNKSLDDWRVGRRGEVMPQDVGTLRWFFRILKSETKMWTNLAPRSRKEYERIIEEVLILPVAKPQGSVRVLADIPIRIIDAGSADRMYERIRTMHMKKNKDGELKLVPTTRNRLAEIFVAIMRKGWRVVSRLHSEFFPPVAPGVQRENPWVGIELEKRKVAEKQAATREEAYSLAERLVEMGHTSLGAGVLISFEWHQRPENIQTGCIKWQDYEPGKSVRIVHHKTGKMVDHPLRDTDGTPFYPELEEFLAKVERLGEAIVLMRGPRSKVPRQYTRRRAAALVQQARKRAGLPNHVTWDACRHGGITELTDAGATENEGMASSGHESPEAFRRYGKKNRTQRMNASRKRRAWLATDNQPHTPEQGDKAKALAGPKRHPRTRPETEGS